MSRHRQHHRRQPGRPLPALVLISMLLASLPATGAAHAICNGSPAGGEYEFVVALFDANLQCSGTVLPSGWILTAAHCGDVLRAVFLNKPGRLTISECYRHPDFNEATLENDLAMMRLANPPAGLQALPPVDAGWKEGQGESVTIAGWSGCTNVLSDLLGHASVLTVPVADCAAKYAGQKSSFAIDPTKNLCTEVGKSRVFNADSGGPVIVQVNNHPRLAGVISVGVGAMQLPDRHTRMTTDYLTWIQKVQAGDQQARSRRCGT